MVKFYISAFADEAGATIDEQIAALKRNNINYIEPRGIDGQCVIFKTDDELKEIKRKLDENGIKVSSIGSPIGKYNITDDFEAHLVDFRKAINAAKILGTKNIRMFSFFIPEGKYASYRDEVIRRLSVMLEEAKKEGITLCHENEADIYGQNVAEVKDLLESLPELKGIFDPANYLLTNNSPVAGFDVTLPHLEYIHIKDALEYEKMIVPAGEGEGLIGEAIVKANDYFEDKTIFLTLEPHLANFIGYSDIDARTLKGKYSFSNTNESFDFAVKALEKLMTEYGFEKNSDNTWTVRSF